MSRTHAVAALLLAGAAMANANIIYEVNLPVGAGSVIGSITTDGTIGTLGQSNVVDWNLVINNGSSSFDLEGPLSGNNSGDTINGSDLSASAAQLLFNFAGGDNGYDLFQNPTVGSGMNFVCFSAGGCANPGQVILEVDQASGDQYSGVESSDVIGTAAPEPGALSLAALGACLLLLRYRKATS